MKYTQTLLLLLLCAYLCKAQEPRQAHTLLQSFRPHFSKAFSYVDLDNDGDPDLIRTRIFDSIPAIWIDDDDNMTGTESEGDLINDCLLIDRNNDGIFAGPSDLSIDWIDTDNDGMADIQVVVENSDPHALNNWDWKSNCMWVIDTDHDQQFNFIDWKKLMLRCWTHSGASDFFEDYHGKSVFLKTHIPSYRFGDLRYNWENPFLFYDTDNDGLTEMAVRLEDDCDFNRKGTGDIDAYPNKFISRASLTFDLDNDNSPQNEFDFDLSINFRQGGFPYDDQVHKFNNMRGLPEANYLFYDSRWRNLNELIYADHGAAWSLIFNRGVWKQCWMTFDEDDDCERWERVEFYEPKNPFRIGMGKGGIDNNPQADATGDRGEWDEDNSGNGNLYIGFDGKIHLFGAEKGYWRIDQKAASYQGWGGLYEGQYKRDQTEPEVFPTIAYEDNDGDGFFDIIRYDLDGDTLYEQTNRFSQTGIPVNYMLLNTATASDKEISALFEKAATEMWENAMVALDIARKAKLNYQWYAYYLSPKSPWQKYTHGFWLQLYIYRDLKEAANKKENAGMIENIDKAYYGRNWKLLEKYYRKP